MIEVESYSLSSVSNGAACIGLLPTKAVRSGQSMIVSHHPAAAGIRRPDRIDISALRSKIAVEMAEQSYVYQ